MNAVANMDINTEISVAFRENVKIEMIKNRVQEELHVITETESELLNVTLEKGNEELNTVHQFFLKEWEGNEDILELCSYYLTWLDSFMEKMQGMGYIG